MQKISLTTTIPFELAGQRLDQALTALFPQYSRARLQQWIKEKSITINGQPCQAKDKVKGGELIEIQANLPPQISWKAEKLPLNIHYEDEDLLIINKPVGIVTHPAAGSPHSTLVNALLHHAPQLQQLPRAGIIHRLDKDTSGLLVIAKSLEAHTHLVQALQAREIQREYEAIVTGIIIAGGTVDAPIGRHPKMRTRMAVLEVGGKPARTHYRVLERFRAHTRIQVKLETGRTHQIRVHMAHIHHPLIGDPVYGGRLQIPANASTHLQKILREFKHQALHAKKLVLLHPVKKQEMIFEAEAPIDFKNLIEILRTDGGEKKN